MPKAYVLPEKDNQSLFSFYKALGIFPHEEWDVFWGSLRTTLPSAFRFSGSKRETRELIRFMRKNYIYTSNYCESDDCPSPPKILPWYPDELAWSVDPPRKELKKIPVMKNLQKFLVDETACGSISRQEAVSMLPPLLLDIRPHSRVLDMCAAPGSKTAQLIEMIHGDESQPSPLGFVVANDADNKRCYMMVHQIKRVQSPNCVIVNHDASYFPNIRFKENEIDLESNLLFDRILCDVPCSGDGTLRKNPDLWRRWTPASGPSLHGLQCRILRRGLELLAVGGRLIYSTCSMNPIEDEAVVSATLQKCGSAVRIVPISPDKLPGLRTTRGVTSWKVLSKQGHWYATFEELPAPLRSVFRPTMFPSAADYTIKGLEECIRIFPHHNNTGGFFVAVLEKVDRLPWQRDKVHVSQPEDQQAEAVGKTKDSPGEGTTENTSSPTDAPAKKKLKIQGFKEDPFIYLDDKDELWNPIRDFYGIKQTLPANQLLVRSTEGKRRTIYFTCKAVRTIVELNRDHLKIVNTGIRLLARNEHPESNCLFRPCQEGILEASHFFSARHVNVTADDLSILLTQDNPYFSKLSPSAQEVLTSIGIGGVVFHYFPTSPEELPQCPILLAGWRGRVSSRCFINKHERLHFQRLCGLVDDSGLLENSADSDTKPVYPAEISTNCTTSR